MTNVKFVNESTTCHCFWIGEGSRTGRVLFFGKPPNVINSLNVMQYWREEEPSQLNRTVFQMKNEIIRLRRGDDLSSINPP